MGVGWGRGSELCVPRRPPLELPPRARRAGAASLACPCIHTRTPACTRRLRIPAARARVGARPSLPPAVPSHLLCPQGCLCLTRSVDPRRGSSGIPHNFLRSPTPSPDPCWDFRTPGQGVPRTCARQRAYPLQLLTAAPPHSADPCPFTFRLCPFTGWVLSWRCPYFFSHLSLGPHFCAAV